MKSKRILALTGAVILIALYVSSIIFALMDSPLAENLLLASLFCTIVIPAVLYGYAVALRYFKKKKYFYYHLYRFSVCIYFLNIFSFSNESSRFSTASILAAKSSNCAIFVSSVSFNSSTSPNSIE